MSRPDIIVPDDINNKGKRATENIFYTAYARPVVAPVVETALNKSTNAKTTPVVMDLHMPCHKQTDEGI